MPYNWISLAKGMIFHELDCNLSKICPNGYPVCQCIISGQNEICLVQFMQMSHSFYEGEHWFMKCLGESLSF
jgi:hypothetical protein